MSYVVQDGRVYNEGKTHVAIAFYENHPHMATLRNGHKYGFQTKASTVCMAWIPVEDVDLILATLGGCCGQKRPGVYRLSSEINTKRWDANNANIRS